MQHQPGFLKLVNESKRKVRETTPENQKILAAQKDNEEVILRHPAAAAKVYRVK